SQHLKTTEASETLNEGSFGASRVAMVFRQAVAGLGEVGKVGASARCPLHHASRGPLPAGSPLLKQRPGVRWPSILHWPMVLPSANRPLTPRCAVRDQDATIPPLAKSDAWLCQGVDFAFSPAKGEIRPLHRLRRPPPP